MKRLILSLALLAPLSASAVDLFEGYDFESNKSEPKPIPKDYHEDYLAQHVYVETVTEIAALCQFDFATCHEIAAKQMYEWRQWYRYRVEDARAGKTQTRGEWHKEMAFARRMITEYRESIAKQTQRIKTCTE